MVKEMISFFQFSILDIKINTNYIPKILTCLYERVLPKIYSSILILNVCGGVNKC